MIMSYFEDDNVILDNERTIEMDFGGSIT